MNKSDIISATSIEFILSKNEAEKIVDIIFKIMSESLKENKNLDIPKFGEFKVISSDTSNDRSVRFSPSKKLLKKVNYFFSDLEKTELQYIEPEIIKSNDEFSYTISKEFLKQKKELEISGNNILPVKEETSTIGENVKKLISEELVKLHKEIIEFSNGSEERRNNLWG